MRQKLTPAFVAKPPVPASDRAIYWDSPGFGLQVTAQGHQSFVCQYRVGRRSYRMALKHGLTLQQARKEAKKLLGDVARGSNPLAERRKAAHKGENTFKSIAEAYLKQSENRSAAQMRAALERLAYPRLGLRPVTDITRGDINRLLDNIAEERGPTAADQALSFIRTILNWHSIREETYVSPIVRGMARTKPTERARTRVLSDDELRAVWKATEAPGRLVGPFIQFLLLTGCRRNEAAQMARNELDGHVWTIPSARSKNGREQVLPLSPAAMTALARLPHIGDRWIFTFDGSHAFANFSKAKSLFDKECGVTGWTLHDLRRTARSLMSRAGVDANVAERCLGHAIGGIRGIYDRHAYFDEKKRAFESLASLVERIINPPAENVISLAEARN